MARRHRSRQTVQLNPPMGLGPSQIKPHISAVCSNTSDKLFFCSGTSNTLIQNHSKLRKLTVFTTTYRVQMVQFEYYQMLSMGCRAV
jgi:hypothetical protein